MEYEDPVQLADLLQRQIRRLRRAQAHRLAPLGLTPGQERALRIITRSEEPLRMTELADRLGIVPRSVTTVIDALEEAGLVRREIDPHKRRAIRLHLTDRGLSVRGDMREGPGVRGRGPVRAAVGGRPPVPRPAAQPAGPRASAGGVSTMALPVSATET